MSFSVRGWTLVFPALPSLSPCTFPHGNYISCHGNRDVIGTGGLNDIQKHSLQRGLKCIPWLTALGCVVYVEGGVCGDCVSSTIWAHEYEVSGKVLGWEVSGCW